MKPKLILLIACETVWLGHEKDQTMKVKVPVNITVGKKADGKEAKTKIKAPAVFKTNTTAKETKIQVNTSSSGTKSGKSKETKIKIKTESKELTRTKTTKKVTTGKVTKNKTVSSSREIKFTPLFTNFSPTVAFKQVVELKWNRIRILILVLLVVITLLHIISTSTKEWLNFNSTQSHGLWRICYHTGYTNDLECFRYDVLPEYVRQIQALMMVAMVLLFGGIIYFTFWMRKSGGWPAFLLIVIVEAAAILMLVSMAIYTDKNFCLVARSKIGTFGWSYYLGWVTTLLTIGTGILVLLDDKYQ